MKITRKIIPIILVAVMLLTTLNIIPFTVSAATISNFQYKKANGDYIIITGYKGTDTDVKIPAKLGKYKVAGIAESAFANKKKITSVTIADGIGYIEDYAFENCTKLSKISLPYSLLLVGESAFLNTAYYKNENNWENNALYINRCLIEYKGEEEEYTIKEGTTVIGDCAFNNVKELKKCTIPESVFSIGDLAFANTSIEGELVFSDNMLIIGTSAYYNTKITSVEMSDNLIILGTCVFEATPITYAKFPKNFSIIPNAIFRNCNQLTKVKFPNNLVEIGRRAFSGTKLKSVTIPKTVQYIGPYAFACSVETIKLPNQYISMDATVFQGSSYYYNNKNWTKDALYIGKHLVAYRSDANKLEVKYGTKYIVEKLCAGHEMLNNVVIPETVVYVGKKAFYNCWKLAKVSIPPSVKYIGDMSFGIVKYEGEDYRLANYTIEGFPESVANDYAKAYGFKFKDGSVTKTIKLNKKQLTIAVGEKYTLKKTADPIISASNAKWSSSNKAVVKVNKHGEITAVKKGQANITITAKNGKKATCKVTVKNPPKKPKLNITKLTTYRTDSFTLTFTGENGSYINPKNIKWTTSDKKVLKLKNTTGKNLTVVANKVGTATVTATTFNGAKVSCEITVKQTITKLKLDKNQLIMGKGEICYLNYTTNEDAYITKGNKPFFFKDYNIIATSLQKNNVIKVRAKRVGTTDLTTYIFRKAVTCDVIVKEAPENVTMNETELTLNVGDSFVLTGTVNKNAYANPDNIKWTADKDGIVEIVKQEDGSATLTALGRGTTIVTITTYNGKTATCKVTVI